MAAMGRQQPEETGSRFHCPLSGQPRQCPPNPGPRVSAGTLGSIRFTPPVAGACLGRADDRLPVDHGVFRIATDKQFLADIQVTAGLPVPVTGDRVAVLLDCAEDDVHLGLDSQAGHAREARWAGAAPFRGLSAPARSFSRSVPRPLPRRRTRPRHRSSGWFQCFSDRWRSWAETRTGSPQKTATTSIRRIGSSLRGEYSVCDPASSITRCFLMASAHRGAR